jgi:glycosyltransferase involved in cell wall biosynthesis
VSVEIGIAVTARDEADRLPATLAALAGAFPDAAVVVADDGSRDGTQHVALQAGADVVRSPRGIGKGGAATLGVERLLELGVERAVVVCDGDLGDSARELPRLVAALDAGDGAGHDRLAAEAARALEGCDVIALAQFSLARAAPAVAVAAAAAGKPVFTTPDSAVRKLRALLQAG